MFGQDNLILLKIWVIFPQFLEFWLKPRGHIPCQSVPKCGGEGKRQFFQNKFSIFICLGGKFAVFHAANLIFLILFWFWPNPITFVELGREEISWRLRLMRCQMERIKILVAMETETPESEIIRMKLSELLELNSILKPWVLAGLRGLECKKLNFKELKQDLTPLQLFSHSWMHLKVEE